MGKEFLRYSLGFAVVVFTFIVLDMYGIKRDKIKEDNRVHAVEMEFKELTGSDFGVDDLNISEFVEMNLTKAQK